MDFFALALIIALPFVAGLAAALLPSDSRTPVTWLAGLTAATCLALTFSFYPAVSSGHVVRYQIDWIPQLGLGFTLRMDGFAWVFASLVSAMALLVVIYTRYYISREDPVRRFYLLFLGFMGSMLGIVLSGNLILLVVFWELTSLFSFLLIGYWHHKQAARDGARMALTITSVGGLSLLAGILVIGHIVGSYDLDAVLASGNAIREHHLYVPALLLFLLGVLTKSAQFPFHFWLPNAMAAPTPVSAFLHSATLVKGGVFLMARLWPVLAGTPEWFTILGLAGMASFVLGAYLAMFQQDLKGLLAYSTISHLGLITLLLSLGSPLAAVAAIFHMLNHATFKASLFMAAGIIDHEAGTRDLRQLSGLFRYMPITGTLATVASAAMAGVPLLNGFLSKEMFFAEAVETHANSWVDTIAPYAAVLGSTLAVTYSIRLIHSIFLGAPPPESFPREPHEPPFWMRFPVMCLVVTCLVVGIIPGLTIGPFLRIAVTSVLGEATPAYSLAIWHGFTIAFGMSVIALVCGTMLYLVAGNYLEHTDSPPVFGRIQGQRLFERTMVAISWRWARSIEEVLGTRRLQPQVRLLVAVAIAAGAIPILSAGLDFGPVGNGIDIAFTGLWCIGMVCAVAAAYLAKFHRLAALALLGGAGLVTCVTFVWLSAPDLAATQLAVEIVTTVLILLGLRWLPKRWRTAEEPIGVSDRLRRLRDLSLAVMAGSGMTVVSLAVLTRTSPDSIADFFIENAYTEGGGRNVVNVILVDFRGFDTLGEITVLGIVALTVFALLRRFRPAPDTIERPEQQRIQQSYDEAEPDRKAGATATEYLYVPSVIMQWMFPVVIVLAAYLFLRGHDAPGGGFVAGVALAAGFILQYMAAGTVWVEDRLRILPVVWMGVGLLLAALTGVASILLGDPFLTSYFQYADVPVLGKIPLASATVFDLGVFSLVVGATVLMLIAIAHQSIRRLRAARLEEARQLEEKQQWS
ncbi:monovalent cation/H+ antiporter subunit A [Chelatococcus composti]|jgi:Tmonovalent cation:proton antiporter|uniref:Multicomponent K+:H+ antiporter subunit A n=2 Tax=Chelatococcus composti TaxID=1743235 RepID=A0A841KAH2_9HYPH|nr:multicomponent K+:H+ antiporter subunit A [Chelatococcus composti]GGG48255.1 monovalent cation/H+ antiporter subunit A [Chelatococcus composti]